MQLDNVPMHICICNGEHLCNSNEDNSMDRVSRVLKDLLTNEVYFPFLVNVSRSDYSDN